MGEASTGRASTSKNAPLEVCGPKVATAPSRADMMALWPHSTTAASAEVRVGKAAYSRSDKGTEFVVPAATCVVLVASSRHAAAPAADMKDFFVKTMISMLQYSVLLPEYDVARVSFDLNWPATGNDRLC